MLESGSKAPDFDLATDEGATVSLAGFAGKTLVLYFYPKDDTTGCTAQAVAFSAHIAAFTAAGTTIVGVSRDSLAAHAKFRKKYDLKVMLGSDADGAVTERYGVWVEKSMYGKKYMGIERTTVLIDASGIIRQVWSKVKVPGHAEAVLTAVKALG